MSSPAEKKLEQIGLTQSCDDHDYEMIHELDNRVDTLRRYGQDLTNADCLPSLQYLRRQLKRQEQETLEKRQLHVTEEVHSEIT